MTVFRYDEVKCPDCGGKMVSRKGKFGTFWGCLKFPECKGTRDLEGRSKKDRQEYKEDQARERGEEYHADIDTYENRIGNDVPLATFNRKKT